MNLRSIFAAVVSFLLLSGLVFLGFGEIEEVLAQDGVAQSQNSAADQSSAESTVTQEILLEAGWNMISSYISPSDPQLETMLAGIAGELVLLKDGAGNIYWPAYGINNIGQWQPDQGYQLYMSSPATLTISGDYIYAPDAPQTLNAGWNMIAYHRDTVVPIEDALASISGAIMLVKDNFGGVYWPEYEIKTIGAMLPWQGYQVYLNEAATLTYPSGPTQVCGTISEDTTWTATESPYITTCGITIGSGATLTLAAGVQVKPEYSIEVSGGTLAVQGTAEAPVIFTSPYDDNVGGDSDGDGGVSSPTAGDWGGISVSSGGQVTMSHAELRHSGWPGLHLGDESTALLDHLFLHDNLVGINVSPNTGSTASLTMSDSTIIAGAGNEGLYAYGSGISHLDLQGNTFGGRSIYYANPQDTLVMVNNSGQEANANSFEINGETGQDITLTAAPGMAYILSNQVIAGTFTLDAGAQVKVSGIAVTGGIFAVNGTAEAPVLFTSRKDDTVGGDTNNDGTTSSPAPGDYGSISVSGGQVTMSHAELRYGGGSSYSYVGALDLRGNTTTTLDHVSFHDNIRGISVRPASIDTTSLTVTNGSIFANTGYGIYVLGAGMSQVNITGSNIVGNGYYGIFNETSYPVNAENNWWGNSSGPAPYGSGDGINYDICYDDYTGLAYVCHYYVDADPWIGQTYAQQSQQGSYGPTSLYQYFEADPVNTATGNHAYSYTDISMPTRGLPLAFSRAYNSLNPQDGPLGWGWTHSWNVFLTENDDQSVMITFGDAHAEMWSWNGSTYDGLPGIHGKLIKNGDNSFDLEQKDHTRYHFAPDGKLVYAEDNSGNRTTQGYDGQGRLVTIGGPAGRTLTLSYNSGVSSDLISIVTDPAGRTVSFDYSTNGDLVSVTDVRGKVLTATYDPNHRLLSMTDAKGHTFVTNVYDSSGRVVEQYDADGNGWTFAYDEVDKLTLVTDPLGRVTKYDYDGEGRLEVQTDALNQTESFTYDGDNNRLSWTDKRGYSTSYEYDGRGNTIAITDTLDFASSFSYDAFDNLLIKTDPLGNTTTYAYDANYNLTSVTDALSNVSSFTYDGLGQMQTSTDANGHTTSYGYDVYGHRTSVTDPLNHTSNATYDISGRLQTSTDANNHTTTYTYNQANHVLTSTDALGNTTTSTYDDVGNRVSITDLNGGMTSFTYDAKDQLATTTDPLGFMTTYGYDVVGNQSSITDPLGHTTTTTFDALNRQKTTIDALGHTSTYGYDANGNRTSVTDANGNVTIYTYDEGNELEAVTDAESGVVTYAYDGNGNRIGLTDTNGHSTNYAFDALNRLETVTDPLGHVISYGYDAVGNRTSQTKADGTVITYIYDDADRLTNISTTELAIVYVYDPLGNRESMTDATGTTTHNCDALNRITEVSGPAGVLTYTYDANGNRETITYPGSKKVSYDYDLNDRLETVTDWNGQVTTYAYDDAGRQTGIAFPNGVEATYVYDAANRLTNLTHEHPTNGVIASFGYTLDDVGNRLTMLDWEGVTTYDYDNLYRLTEVTYPDGEVVTYIYDPMGNRLTMVSTVYGSTSYTYDAADRLLTAGTTTFAWDANGNMTDKGATTFTWDALDRLTQVTDGATTVAYAYDGDNARLGKTVNGVTTEYLQDTVAPLQLVVAETTNGQTDRYIYGSDLIALEDSSAVLSYYHPDGLGSTRALSDASGTQTDSYLFRAFGSNYLHSGGSTQSMTFAGEQEEFETSLLYMRSRYYDPETGRFLKNDRARGSLLFSQSLNLYIYVYNNPTNMVDPEGYWGISTRFNVGGAGGYLGGGEVTGGIGLELEFRSWNPLDWEFGFGTSQTTKVKSGPYGEFSPVAGSSVYIWREDAPIPVFSDAAATFCGGASLDALLGGSIARCTGKGKTGWKFSSSLKGGAGAHIFGSMSVGDNTELLSVRRILKPPQMGRLPSTAKQGYIVGGAAGGGGTGSW